MVSDSRFFMDTLNEYNLDDIGARPGSVEAAATDTPINVRLWTIVLLFAFTLTTVASIRLVSTLTHGGLYRVFWPPNGILTVLLLITTGRIRLMSIAVAAVVNLLVGIYVGDYPFLIALSATASKILEVTLTVALSRRMLGPVIDFSRFRTLCRFALLCATPAVIMTITLILPVVFASLVFTGKMTWASLTIRDYWALWRGVALQEFYGIVMVAPALYVIVVPHDRGLFVRSALERTVLFGLLLAAEFALFALSSTPALFVVFPVLVGIGFRLGPRGAGQAILITTLAAAGFTVSGAGPFATFHQAELFGIAGLLQIFLLAVLYSVLPAAGAIAEKLRSEEELKLVHHELVHASRLAGRAEIASGVLHNVGNAMQSVNVSANLLVERVRHSRVSGLQRLVELLRHENLNTFVASERGRHLPDFLEELSRQLAVERQAVSEELLSLQHNIQHVNEIVAMQQSYAKRAGVWEEIDLTKLVEDSLRMGAEAFGRRGVELTKELTPLPPVKTDKHKLMEILVNLIRNAGQACEDSSAPDKQVTVTVAPAPCGAAIMVTDNGVGIPPENMTRIFHHGFTTRASGHGFGLHSAALAAKELGGSLSVHSDGTGRGAVFTLNLPLSAPETRHAA
jgi:signal transduction histidine kinase